MYKFLSDYNYEMSKNVPDNLKCQKCKNILVNACQVPCGCQYCQHCVNEMLENGVEYCPGNTDDCMNKFLSHNVVDYRANKEISKLVLKCPVEMCFYECELINMEEHLRICGKKSVKCPFYDLGCDDKKISSEMINEHCQLANFSHNKILIEIIDNIREKEEKNKNEIEKLMENLKVKDEVIDSINEEFNQLWEELKSLKENLGNKIEEISVEMKNGNLQLIESINNEINGIKMKNAELAQQVNISKVELENKIAKINEKIEKENERMKIEGDEHKQEYKILKENLEKTRNEEERKKKSEMEMETKMNELSRINKILYPPLIEWTIDKLDKRMNQNEGIFSEFSVGMVKPYRLQLSFYPNGCNDFIGKGCSIWLWIYPGAEHKVFHSKWPFKADVTIKVVNKTNPNASQSITQYCQTDEPQSNYSHKRSDPFNYSHSDLIKAGVMKGNCFIVECFVNFK